MVGSSGGVDKPLCNNWWNIWYSVWDFCSQCKTPQLCQTDNNYYYHICIALLHRSFRGIGEEVN